MRFCVVGCSVGPRTVWLAGTLGPSLGPTPNLTQLERRLSHNRENSNMDAQTLQEAQETNLMPTVDGKPVCNLFEEMIAAGKVTFSLQHDITQEENLTQQLVALMEGWGVRCEVASQKLGRSVLLKTDDPYIQYIDVYPEKEVYLMCGPKHQESIPEGDAMVYLMVEKRGLSKEEAEAWYNSVSHGDLDGMNVYVGTMGKA